MRLNSHSYQIINICEREERLPRGFFFPASESMPISLLLQTEAEAPENVWVSRSRGHRFARKGNGQCFMIIGLILGLIGRR